MHKARYFREPPTSKKAKVWQVQCACGFPGLWFQSSAGESPDLVLCQKYYRAHVLAFYSEDMWALVNHCGTSDELIEEIQNSLEGSDT